MSKVSCIFYEDSLSYELFFKSNVHSFFAIFKITCPQDFNYKPVKIYDGFVFAIILKAMEIGEDLTLDFPVSKEGIRNINYYVEAWHNLLPQKYKKITLNPTTIVNKYKREIDNDECISAFSGGVDASFSLIRHAEKDWGNASFTIKNVLCVHGFDVPAEKEKEYEQLIQRISPIYKQYQCKEFKVWTDIKEKSKQNWEMSFSTQLAACLHLFSEHFKFGIIGSSEPYRDFFLPWGSTPATDFLLSGASMQIVHDGAGYSRTEKVERIAKNQAATDYVKVCWERGFQENCGQCEKCYRTRLNFLAVGVSAPKCFDTKIALNKILTIKINSPSKAKEFSSIIEYIGNNNDKKNIQFLILLTLFKWFFYFKPLYYIRNFRKELKGRLKKLF